MLYVANIEVIEEEVDVFDITVETDESFICAGAVLHNCPRCAEIGGKRFPVNAKDIPALPVHPRCRCVYLPVTELSDSASVKRPAANSDFMSDAKRAYEEKNTGRSWDSLSESTKHKYYYEAISEYEARTGKPAFEQVPGSMKFTDYFESRDSQFKRDWLGPVKYKLYRKGNLSLNEML